MLRTATVAATRARERGGARAELATQGMRRRLLHAAEIEQGLRRALTDGELRLHYQPIVDLSTGTIVAVEAFVRWQHPDHGLLAPAQFLAAAEATGLAVPLGAEILVARLPRARALGARPRATTPSLRRRPCTSTSPRATSPRPGSPARSRARCARSGLEPDRLVLEIAETMFTGEGQVAMAQLDDLRGVGVRIALDRFGTGYSSLAAIRQLPFDALKVDSSFLTELGDGASTRDARRALIEAMIGIGRSLGLPMTAAKVETEQQLRLLRSLGLDRAQGELFAPPLSADAALELVRSGQVWASLLEATRPRAAARRAPSAPAGARAAARGQRASPRGALLSLGQAAQALRDLDDDRAPLGRRRAPRRDAHGRRAPALRRRRRCAACSPSAAARRSPPAEAPRRALPGLAALVEEPRRGARASSAGAACTASCASGFFVDPEGVAAASAGSARCRRPPRPRTTRCCTQATSALMRAAERGGASLLERHLALERFAETVDAGARPAVVPARGDRRGAAAVRRARPAPARRRGLTASARARAQVRSRPTTEVTHGAPARRLQEDTCFRRPLLVVAAVGDARPH